MHYFQNCAGLVSQRVVWVVDEAALHHCELLHVLNCTHRPAGPTPFYGRRYRLKCGRYTPLHRQAKQTQ